MALSGRNVNLLTDRFWLAAISFCFLMFCAVHIDYHRYPQPTSHSVENSRNNVDKFQEENARDLLDSLCQHGPRLVGSSMNEVIAKDEIIKRVMSIKDKARSSHVIELDIQDASGCLSWSFDGPFTTCYSNVTNVVVRLSSALGKSSSSLLVSCHYDSAISSPGASDDLISCATMLEALRALSQSDSPLRHSIVFNFNGAEESGLQASHGFITKHPWTKELKAFVNLEAAGAGGREMVFQIGPEHPWLISAYAKSVRYPFASVIGQEIFQSGLIPSDTDYRIYRDYGKIPGIDLAYTYNGYLYHTKYDRPEYIPRGSLQRAGENSLNLLRYLANSDKLENPGEARLGKIVFFDFLGLFMVHYPEKLGQILNVTTIISTLLVLFGKIKIFKDQGKSPYLYMKLIGACYTIHGAALVAMVIVNLLIAFTVNTKRPMMWFTNNWLVVPVYLLPSISVWILVHQLSHRWYSTVFKLVSIWDLETIFFDAAMLFWTLLLAMLTYIGLGSAYVFLLLVVFPLTIRQLLANALKLQMYASPVAYIVLTYASLVVPFLHLNQLFYQLYIFFLPMLGRVGSEAVPDVVVALLALLTIFVLSIYQAGFLHVSKNQAALAVKLIIVCVLFSLIGCFSNLGFPYDANPDSPSCQRHIVQHFSREFYSINGDVEKADHGLLYLPYDRNGAKYLQHIPEIASLKQQKLDPDHAYSGWPFYTSRMITKSRLYMSDLGKPLLKDVIKMRSKKENLSPGLIRYRFTVSAKQSYLHIYISLRDGAELIGWSFIEGTPAPSKMPDSIKEPHYFIYTVSAKQSKDREFWLDIKIPSDSQRSDQGSSKEDESAHWLNIAFAVHHLDGQDDMTPELGNLLSRFPDWTVPIGWASLYQHYKL